MGVSNGDQWPMIHLARVATLTMGQAPEGSSVHEWDDEVENLEREGLPFIQGNAEFGARFPKPEKWCVRPSKIALRGDYLISVRAPVGELNEANQTLAIGRGLAAVRFHGVDERFGWQSLWEARKAFGRVSQGSTFEAINSKDLAELAIPIPPRQVQLFVGQTLDAVDLAIEKTEAVIEATETLRKALLQELLTRGVPGWHSEWKTVPGIGTIPACWDVVKLGEVAEVQSGIALGLDRRADGIRTPYLTVAHVAMDRVTVGETLRYMHLRPAELGLRLLGAGDAVMVEGHAQISQLGRAALVPREADGFAYQNHLFRVRGQSDHVTNEFIVALANSPVGRDYFAQFGGTTSGLNTVSTTNVRRMAFGNPPIQEQQRIVAIVACVDGRLERERQLLTHLRGIKRETASALLSGRVRVPVRALG